MNNIKNHRTTLNAIRPLYNQFKCIPECKKVVKSIDELKETLNELQLYLITKEDKACA